MSTLVNRQKARRAGKAPELLHACLFAVAAWSGIVPRLWAGPSAVFSRPERQEDRQYLTAGPHLPRYSGSARDNTPRVRMAIRLVPYELIATRSADGSVRHRVLASLPVTRVLNARLTTANHFYVADWHIETSPIAWSAQTHEYKFVVSVYRRSDPQGVVEEKKGSFVVTDHLGDGPQMYAFRGKFGNQIRNEMGEPVIHIALSPPPAIQTKLSRLEKSE